MGMTLFLFDKDKKHRKTITQGLQEVIHKESDYSATVEMLGKNGAENGQYFGFRCVDGKFRLFLIVYMDLSDETGVCTLTGTDAAVAELENRIREGTAAIRGKTAVAAAETVLSGTGWSLGDKTGAGTVNVSDPYFEPVWETLTVIAKNAKVRITPYYTYDNGAITGKVVDVTARVYPYRGLIHTKQKGTRNILITTEGVPYGRVYPLGKIQTSENPPQQVTIAGAAWSKSAGKPVDKPLGQTWVAIEGADANAAQYRYEDRNEEDPAKLLQAAYDDLVKKSAPTVRGTATIGEMEFLPGYGHRIVRRFDKAVVRTSDGVTAEAVVTDVERYYIKRWLTKITLGDEDDADETLEDQIAAASELAQEGVSSGGGAGAGVKENKVLILEAEELIQLNSQKIELRATKVEVQQLAEQTTTQFTELTVELDTAKAAIALKANQTEVDNLNNVVSNMSAELTVQAGLIATKVEKDGVISAINQTAEQVKIQAAKIDLEGYVTASQLSAEIADIRLAYSSKMETTQLIASQATVSSDLRVTGNMRYGDRLCNWGSKTVVTGVSFPIPQFGTLEYMKPDGTAGSVLYMRGYNEAGSTNTSTMNYMSYVQS